MIAHISFAFWALSGRELQLMACCGCPRDAAHTDAQTERVNRGRVVAGGDSWLDGANLFRRRDFRLENRLRARTLFRRTQGLSAAARSLSKPLWKPLSACPQR